MCKNRWKKPSGFRYPAHRYGDVNHDVVYAVLHNDLHWLTNFNRKSRSGFSNETNPVNKPGYTSDAEVP